MSTYSAHILTYVITNIIIISITYNAKVLELLIGPILLLSLRMHNLFPLLLFLGLVYIIQTDLGYKVSFIERRVTCVFCPSTS
jgi:hypothetical protein